MCYIKTKLTEVKMKNNFITNLEAQEIFLEAFYLTPNKAQEVLTEYREILENVTLANLVRGNGC